MGSSPLMISGLSWKSDASRSSTILPKLDEWSPRSRTPGGGPRSSTQRDTARGNHMAALRIGIVGSRFAAHLHLLAYRRVYGVEAQIGRASGRGRGENS